MTAKFKEDSPCPGRGCSGRLVVWDPDNCTCHHVAPPCGACSDCGLTCPDCGWILGDEVPDPDGGCGMSYPTDFAAMAQSIRADQIRAFGDGPDAVLLQALVLNEEAGEIARLAAKERQGIRPDSRGDWEHEIADVLLVAFGLAAMHGLDPEHLVRSAAHRLRVRADKAEKSRGGAA